MQALSLHTNREKNIFIYTAMIELKPTRKSIGAVGSE